MNEKELPRFNALIRSEYSRGYEPILTLGGARGAVLGGSVAPMA